MTFWMNCLTILSDMLSLVGLKSLSDMDEVRSMATKMALSRCTLVSAYRFFFLTGLVLMALVRIWSISWAFMAPDL